MAPEREVGAGPLIESREIPGLFQDPIGDVYVRRPDGTVCLVGCAGGGGGGAPADAEYVTLAADPTLTNERILTPGDGITLVDGGAGGPATLDVLFDGTTIQLNGANELEVITANVLTDAVIIDPGSSIRNLITPTGDFIPLRIQENAGGQAQSLFLIEDSTGADLLQVRPTGETLRVFTGATPVVGIRVMGIAGQTAVLQQWEAVGSAPIAIVGSGAAGTTSFQSLARAATNIPIVAQGFAGQSVDHQRWITSAGDVLLAVTSIGAVRRIATAAADRGFSVEAAGDAVERMTIRSDGLIEWGDGALAVDTNLYRALANRLKTDDTLMVSGQLGVGAPGNFNPSAYGGYLTRVVFANAGDGYYDASLTQSLDPGALGQVVQVFQDLVIDPSSDNAVEQFGYSGSLRVASANDLGGTTGLFYEVLMLGTKAATTGDQVPFLQGAALRAYNNAADGATGDVGTYQGAELLAGTENEDGDVTLIQGVSVNAQVDAAAGTTIPTVTGMSVRALTQGRPITDAYGIRVREIGRDAAVATSYGIHIENQADQTPATPVSPFAIWSDGGESRLHAGDPAVTPLVVKGEAAQAASLQEWRDSADTPVLEVGATGFLDMVEIAAPANPAANNLRFYTRDNAGTTELVAHMSDGTIYVLAPTPASTAVGSILYEAINLT